MGSTEEKVAEGGEDEAKKDNLSEALGDFGRWQALSFAALSHPVIVSTFPILIISFMNANVDFWCQRPHHLSHIEPGKWKEISGQHEQRCRMLNGSYYDDTGFAT